MTKKSKRKKQSYCQIHTYPEPSRALFTLPMVKMLREAMGLVEQTMLRIIEPHPNSALAEDAIFTIKNKLDDMLQLEDWETETPFDFNELQILYAAIHMHLADLSLTHRNDVIPSCISLCKQFSLLVKANDAKQAELLDYVRNSKQK